MHKKKVYSQEVVKKGCNSRNKTCEFNFSYEVIAIHKQKRSDAFMSYRNIIYQKKKDNTYIIFLPSGSIEVECDSEIYKIIDDYLSNN